MSVPANPLDVYVTYTYHFELHAHPSWDKLQDLTTKDENKSTDSFTPNGTLLINTRKDAHQSIDDVHFVAQSEASAKTEMLIPYGALSMTVTEPGGFSFIEKLSAMRSNYQVTAAATDSLKFVLKIFFVGRKVDNTIETITAKLIPMVMQPNVTATFSEMGGKYGLTFTTAATLGLTDDPFSGAAMNYAYTKRAVSFSAGTVEEALSNLEKRLNEGYGQIYKTEGTTDQGRPLVYKITWDPDIKGAIETLNKNSNAPGEKSQFTSNPQLQIGSFIQKILQASPKLQQKIGESKPGLQKEGHPNIFIPLIQPRVVYKDDQVLIHYHIAVNKGGMQKSWVFDYYFAEAGKNVDITSYEVKFQNVGAWTPVKIESGFDYTFNQSANMPKDRPRVYSESIVTDDTTQNGTTVEVQRSTLGFQKNDVRMPPRVTANDRIGYTNAPYSATPSYRLASDAIGDFQTSISFQQQFEIRGNLDLLDCTAYYPDGSVVGDLYGGKNVWVKVNIWMLDPRAPGGKRQFYYTNYYKVITVENVFSGGQFKQHLTVAAVPEAENK
jgi:hypothetical protein